MKQERKRLATHFFTRDHDQVLLRITSNRRFGSQLPGCADGYCGGMLALRHPLMKVCDIIFRVLRMETIEVHNSSDKLGELNASVFSGCMPIGTCFAVKLVAKSVVVSRLE